MPLLPHFCFPYEKFSVIYWKYRNLGMLKLDRSVLEKTGPGAKRNVDAILFELTGRKV